MDQNANTAMMMAFGIIVFVLALSISMFMLSSVMNVSEVLTKYSDTTLYYDNVELDPYAAMEIYTSLDGGVIANSYGISSIDVQRDSVTDEVSTVICTVNGVATTITYDRGKTLPTVNPESSIEFIRRCAEEYQRVYNVEFSERRVSAETIIPTLYRYNKEYFSVSIYDYYGHLIQVFDTKLEENVYSACKNDYATLDGTVPGHPFTDIKEMENARDYSYMKIFSDRDGIPGTRPFSNYNDIRNNVYMFNVPWLGNPGNIKTRVDFFVNGQSGYINNTYVDYRNNAFYNARMAGHEFRETFISYSYTGQTFVNDEGDKLVEGASSKDKITIIYTEAEI